MKTWLDRLTSTDEDDVYDVIDEMRQHFATGQKREVPRLIGLLGHANPHVRWGAAASLAAVGADASDAVGTLLDVLDDLDDQVRHDAAVALKMIAPAEPRVIERMFGLFLDPDDDVRGAAQECLWKAGVAALEPARAHLLHEEAEVRRLTLGLIGPLGAQAAPAVPELIRLLSHRRGGTRCLAALALGDAGPAAAEALPALEALISMPLPAVAPENALVASAADLIPTLIPDTARMAMRRIRGEEA